MAKRTKPKTSLLSLLTTVIAFSLTLSACSWFRPYHSTPKEALTEFPGYLTQEGLSSTTVLRKENVAGGLVLLYRYPRDPAGASPVTHCIATTFVTQERNGSWRGQSASKLGYNESVATKFVATFTVGGNITDLTTVYGLAQAGSEVRIEWSDGVITTDPIVDGTFLKSRPATLTVQNAALLNENGSVLESTTWSE